MTVTPAAWSWGNILLTLLASSQQKGHPMCRMKTTRPFPSPTISLTVTSAPIAGVSNLRDGAIAVRSALSPEADWVQATSALVVSAVLSCCADSDSNAGEREALVARFADAFTVHCRDPDARGATPLNEKPAAGSSNCPAMRPSSSVIRILVHEALLRGQRFIYSVFTKDTLDEKGQARDTRVHVTL